MSPDVQQYRFRFRRGTSFEWTAADPVLLAGEPGVETNTGLMKIGDGFTSWRDLPYFGGSGGGSSVELIAHITSENPHPIYDEGPPDGQSLALLYENAKV